MPIIGSSWATDTWHVDAWAANTWATFLRLPLVISDGEIEQLQSGDVLINQEGTVVYAAAAFATDNVILRSDGTGFGSQLSGLRITDDDQLIWNDSNLLIGTNTGPALTTGIENMLLGDSAGRNLTAGSFNILVGDASGDMITVGSRNVGVGVGTLLLSDGDRNVAVGFIAGDGITTGEKNVFIGEFSGTDVGGQLATASNSIGIGSEVVTTADNQMVLGNTSITDTKIRGVIELKQTSLLETNADHLPILVILDSTGVTAFEIIAHTFASSNMFLGSNSTGSAITDGTQNTTFGKGTGAAITTGDDNALIGFNAGNDITTGGQNMCFGSSAGAVITTGSFNALVGTQAGGSISSGLRNTCYGNVSGALITTTFDNTCIGASSGNALAGTTPDAEGNSFLGVFSGFAITTGSRNVFVGYFAGHTGQLATVDDAVALGWLAITTGDNGIAIGANVSAAANQIVLGNVNHTETILRGIVEGDDGTFVSNPTAFVTDNAIVRADTVSGADTVQTSGLSVSDPILASANVQLIFPTTNVIIGLPTTGDALTTGTGNILLGEKAGTKLTEGSHNVIFGDRAGANLTTGSFNFLFGRFSGVAMTDPTGNTGIGVNSLDSVTTGANNVGIGTSAGAAIVAGDRNVFIGGGAGSSVSQLVTAADSIAIGENSFTTKDHQAVFGNVLITETILRGDVEIQNGTTEQNLFIYETFTSDTDHAMLSFTWASGDAVIQTEDGSGGGTAGALILGTDSTPRLTLGASGDITIAEGEDIILGTTTGTIIAAAVGQKLGFWGTTPIVQPADALQAALTNNTGGSQDGILAVIGDTTAVDQGPALNDNLTDIHTLLNEIRDALVDSGIMKGAV